MIGGQTISISCANLLGRFAIVDPIEKDFTMTTKTCIACEALAEGWVDVLWIGDEETPDKLAMRDLEFQIIPCPRSISRKHFVAKALPTPSSSPMEPISCSHASHQSSTVISDHEKSDSTRIRQRSDGSDAAPSIIESVKDTNENSIDGIALKSRRPTRAEYEPIARYNMKFRDNHAHRPTPATYDPIGHYNIEFRGNNARRSSMRNWWFETSLREPLQQVVGDLDTTTIIEGPYKSCRLDEVD